MSLQPLSNQAGLSTQPWPAKGHCHVDYRKEFSDAARYSPLCRYRYQLCRQQCALPISSLNITVPEWLINKKSKNNKRIQALALEENLKIGEIVVLFAENRQITLNPETSVKWLIEKNDNRQTRESMLLKRVVSYSLEGPQCQDLPARRLHFQRTRSPAPPFSSDQVF